MNGRRYKKKKFAKEARYLFEKNSDYVSLLRNLRFTSDQFERVYEKSKNIQRSSYSNNRIESFAREKNENEPIMAPQKIQSRT